VLQHFPWSQRVENLRHRRRANASERHSRESERHAPAPGPADGAPLYNTDYARGFGTLYTAVYWPQTLTARYLWPGFAWDLSIEAFREGTHTVALGMPATSAVAPGAIDTAPGL